MAGLGRVAVMTDVPTATPVARPLLTPAVKMVAVAGVPETQVTVAVRSCFVPSVNVPVATNCWVAVRAIDGLAGVTAIDASVAAVTVKVVMPVMAPLVAEMTVVPTTRLWARPFEPAAFEIVAVAAVADAHVTVGVMSCT